MTAHAFAPAGRMDDGTPRLRCSVCGCCAHWPEAANPCAAIRTAKKRATKQIPTSRLSPMRVCKRCGAEYPRPPKCSKYCSETCRSAAQAEQIAERTKRQTAQRKLCRERQAVE